MRQRVLTSQEKVDSTVEYNVGQFHRVPRLRLLELRHARLMVQICISNMLPGSDS
jgi:hypothetical protein